MQLSADDIVEYSNKKTWQFFASALTALYALVLTILAVTFELSPTWKADIWRAQNVFHLYMYGLGIIYLIYCYAFMIYPQAVNWLLVKANRAQLLLVPTNYSGEGAGTLYLRLGALYSVRHRGESRCLWVPHLRGNTFRSRESSRSRSSFGTLGIVLYGMEIYLTFEESDDETAYYISEHVSAIVFTFLQMHFIFCHSKIRLLGPSKISKLGMMHLVSVNLWTWLRYVTEKEILEVHEKIVAKGSAPREETKGHKNKSSHMVVEWKDLSSSFADFTSFFTTCIVEYSLIGAAVMFILWRSIDHAATDPRVKRKEHMRIDCSRTSRGLFAGVFYVILSFVAIAIFGIDSSLGSTQSDKIFGIVNITLFTIILVASLTAMYRIRLLQYRIHARGEVIDEILLVIGLSGELIYCCIGIDQFISSRGKHEISQSILPLFVFISRAIQVIVQTMLILTVSRLRCYTAEAIKLKPGKQIITFLLVANMALFVFQTFENMKSNIGIDSSADEVYLTIVSIVAPLLVFYRFHSSVCLAESWKNTYNGKEASRRVSTATFLGDETTQEFVIPKFQLSQL